MLQLIEAERHFLTNRPEKEEKEEKEEPRKQKHSQLGRHLRTKRAPDCLYLQLHAEKE
jgi:hypothetical protein